MNIHSPDEARSVFITGLKNAHAMEKQALSIISPQVARLEHYPEMAERLRRHVTETERQVERLDTILQSLNENASGVKDAVLSMAGGMASMSHAAAGDEVLKNTFANFAFEHYEIAAYNSLIVLARLGGSGNAVSLLSETLNEELEMASWIESNIESVTERFVGLKQAGETAKR